MEVVHPAGRKVDDPREVAVEFQDRASFGWGASGGAWADPEHGLVIHYDGSDQGLAGRAHSACVSYWKGTRRFHVGTRGWADIGYCVDEATEILTAQGWKSFREVRPGDVALTLDHENGLSQWQPIEDVYIFPARPRELVRMAGGAHSSLTTPEHRWPVERDGGGRGWATTGSLTESDRVPVAAEPADPPAEAKWSDALVEAVAWFCAAPGDGAAIRGDTGRVRAALRGLFGPPGDVAGWSEEGGTVHLSANAAAVLAGQAPARVVRWDFLRSLTRAQLELFLNVSLSAYGGTAVCRQREKAERFQFAAILAGRATALRPAGANWCVEVSHSVDLAFRAGAVSRESYEGHIWCVRTPNATWLARRAGTVYFTGNSFGACPHGYVMEGRGLNRQQAAQPGGNATWYSCTLMSGPGEAPTDRQIEAVRELRAWLMGKGVAGAVRGHRDFNPTSCPGGLLYRLVENGTFGQAPSEEDEMPDYVSVGMVDAQDLPPGDWVTVRWDEEFSDAGHHHRTEGGPSIIEGHSRYSLTVNLRIEGLSPGTELQARVIERRDSDGAVQAGPIAEYVAGNGATFVHYAVPADSVTDGHRVRFQVVHFGTGTGRVVDGTAKGLAWRV